MSAVTQCPPVPSAAIGSGLVDSWLEGCASAVDGMGKIWAAAFQRGPVAVERPALARHRGRPPGARLGNPARDRVRDAARAAA